LTAIEIVLAEAEVKILIQSLEYFQGNVLECYYDVGTLELLLRRLKM